MISRLRAAFRAFGAAEVRQPTAAEISAVTPLEDWYDDLPPDSLTPLKFRDYWTVAALEYPPLLRCVSMISSECARLITSSVAVVDADGMPSRTRRDERNTMALRESVDGGLTPAFDFWKDVVFDLLTDGNALIVPTVNSDGMLVRLRLMCARYAEYQEDDDAFYGPVLGMGDEQVRVPRSRMAHARMFGSPFHDTGNWREWPFSDSPIRLLSDTLGISRRITRWLNRTLIGPKGSLVLSPKSGRLAQGQQEKLTEEIGRFLRSGNRPLVGGAPLQVDQFGQSAKEADIGTLLGYQLREVARVYGVPLPLIGSPVSAWGSGIEALAREYWKRAIAPRIADVLLPLSHRLCAAGRCLQVDPLELIRGVSGEAAGLIQVLRPNNGPASATTNEIRRIASLPPLTEEQREELDFENGMLVEMPDAGAGEEESGEADGEEAGGMESMTPRTPADLDREMSEMLREYAPVG